MKKIFLTVLLTIALALPFQAHAGALIVDMQTATSATTTVATSAASGDSLFQISAISGTYTTNLKATDTVIPNLSNYERVYSIQVNDIAFADGYPESDNNSGATFEIILEISNLNDSDAWSGASPIVLPAVTMSGNSTYVQSGTLPACEYVRAKMRTGVTPVGRGTVRMVLK